MVAKAQALLKQCLSFFQANKTTEALAELQNVKREIAGFKSNTAVRIAETPDVIAERQVMIDALELGTYLAIRSRDLDMFDRHVTQLKAFYRDFPQLSIKSNGSCLLGLNLLHLLASDRRGEFHQELELLHKAIVNVPHIELPVLLERYLMEGNYEKIAGLGNQLGDVYKEVPSHAQLKEFFGERLVGTVRARVAESLEKSYKSVKAEVAVKMLTLNSLSELQEFARKENERKKQEEEDDISMGDTTPGISKNLFLRIRWEIKDGYLIFTSDSDKTMEVPALDIINNTIGYATDLERIV
eukprot:GEMP01038762.1.p1 GENE.GEMP01038762.1~~GEMP01038762.1.p1  ORF type:complete len:299 (+),score=63.27 GEMP01038762.1:85-981(+)